MMIEGEEESQSCIASDEKLQAQKRPSRYKLWLGLGAISFLVAIALVTAICLTLRQQNKRDKGSDFFVDLGYSRYSGKSFNDGITQWLGIRYAAPPVGNLRFAATQDPLRNATIQIADKYRPRCLSTQNYINDSPIPPSRSEDCLFLNVWAPSDARNNSAKLPVYVFIQGGGFNDNSGTNDARDIIKTSGMGMIYVDFNYRVGPYGFLASSEVQSKGSLNNGLKDQRKALEWIQKYISKFGGDPHHVVLGGASAGAASVTLQLAAYGGRNDNLFHATIAESQSFGAIRSVSESQYQYDELVARTHCTPQETGNKDTLSCLRNLHVAELQKQNVRTKFPDAIYDPLFAYNPTLDDDFVQNYTFALFEAGKFVHVPTIYGDTTDEGTVFVQRNITSVQDQKDFIESNYPTISTTQLDELVNIYPPGNKTFANTGKYWSATAAAYGELRYVCPGIHLSTLYSQYRVPGNFNYRYNAFPDLVNGNGVGHVAELGAIWGKSKPASEQKPSNFNADIPFVIQRYWISFIITFDPNTLRAPGSPKWEEWSYDGEGSGKMGRIVVQDGFNATKMETVPLQQANRCETIIPWGFALTQ